MSKASSPRSAELSSDKGNALLLTDPAQALACYAEASRMDPGNPLYHSQQGNLLSSFGRYRDALTSFDAANDTGGADVAFSAWAKHIDGLYTQKNRQDGNSEYLAWKAQKDHWKNRPAPASAAPKTTLPMVMRTSNWRNAAGDEHHHAGSKHFKNGDLEKALAECTLAIHEAPHNARYHTNKIMLLQKLRRYSEALAACEIQPDKRAAATEKNTTLHSWETYSWELVKRGATEELAPQRTLLAHYANAGNDRTTAKAILANVDGMILFQENRYAEALTSFEQALQYNSVNILARGYKVRTLHRLHRYAETLEYGEHDPDITENTIALWEIHIRKLFSTDKTAATIEREQLADYSNRHPDNKKAQAALAYVEGYGYRSTGHYEKALESYNQAIAYDPTIKIYHMRKVGILNDLNRYTEALDYCAHYPNDPEAIIWQESSLSRWDEHITALISNSHFEQAFVQRTLLEHYARGEHGMKKKALAVLAHTAGSSHLFEKHDCMMALTCFDQAILHDPDKKSFHTSKVMPLGVLRRYPEALKVCDHYENEKEKTFHKTGLLQRWGEYIANLGTSPEALTQRRALFAYAQQLPASEGVVKSFAQNIIQTMNKKSASEAKINTLLGADASQRARLEQQRMENPPRNCFGR